MTPTHPSHAAQRIGDAPGAAPGSAPNWKSLSKTQLCCGSFGMTHGSKRPFWDHHRSHGRPRHRRATVPRKPLGQRVVRRTQQILNNWCSPTILHLHARQWKLAALPKQIAAGSSPSMLMGAAHACCWLRVCSWRIGFFCTAQKFAVGHGAAAPASAMFQLSLPQWEPRF